MRSNLVGAINRNGPARKCLMGRRDGLYGRGVKEKVNLQRIPVFYCIWNIYPRSMGIISKPEPIGDNGR